MPLPPMYFPVYQFHIRLMDPSLHAQPLIQTPPMPHAEGLHTVQWLLSDVTKLTTTVQGDFQRFALRDFDSAGFIPHIPVPVMAGPFLFDTIKNSKFQILIHQPNMQMDGQTVGVFFWGIATGWICAELKLPVPKFLARAAKSALAKAAKSRAASALERIERLQFEADALLDAVDLADVAGDAPAPEAAGPLAEAAKREKEVQDESAKEKKEAAKDKAAEDFVEQEQKLDENSAAEREGARAAAKEKAKADQEARDADREAGEHDAAAEALHAQSRDAPAGSASDAARAERAHNAAAASERDSAARADERAQAHGRAASHHREQQQSAEQRAGEAHAAADEHSAASEVETQRAVGKRSGGGEHSLDAADEHERAAKAERARAQDESRRARDHAEQASSHESAQVAASKEAAHHRDSAEKQDQRARSNALRAEALGKQQEAAKARARAAEAREKSKAAQAKVDEHNRKRKHLKKRKAHERRKFAKKNPKLNPYKRNMGMGNTSVLFPSLLGIVPLPSTVQIYMSAATLRANWVNLLWKAAFSLLDAYVGFIFDAILAPGKSGLAKWAVDFAKGLATGTVLGGLKTYVLEGKISIVVSTKRGPVTATGELSKGENDKDWTWKAKVDAKGSKAVGPTEAQGSLSGSASGTLPSDESKPAPPVSWSADAKGSYGGVPAGGVSYTSDEKGDKTTGSVGAGAWKQSHPLGAANDTKSKPAVLPIAADVTPVDYAHGVPEAS